MSAALEMRAIKKAFGEVQAVTDGNLSVNAGEAMALLGANGAGKSTLMNVLGGLLRPDAGEIVLGGKTVTLAGPKDAARAGIAFVQQELAIFPTMTVAENVFADDFPVRGGRIDRSFMGTRTRELLALLGSNLDPDRPLEGLSTGDCQMVEIARAMRRSPAIVIFDEPTSSLSSREKERFHDLVRRLKGEGVAVVYITHFIGEIFGVCDRVTVMRGGATIANTAVDEITQNEIVEMMLGEVVAGGRIAGEAPLEAPTALAVTALSLPGRVEEATFTVKQGEVVGVWGLLGSGRTELVRALLGLDGPVSGEITVWDGTGLKPATPEAVRARTAFVTEDRKGEGLLLPFSVATNIALPNLSRLSGWAGRIKVGAVRTMARSVMERLSIRASGPGQTVGTLSGGNQQKVVFGKWLAAEPQILILDEPTRGLDLSAKADILRLVVERAKAGAAVLIISSELEELMQVSHRYLVIARRRVVASLPGEASEAALIAALSGEAADSGGLAA
ncbi:MAG: sugar ABC transporter ATP-binding protein [Devosia sp.]